MWPFKTVLANSSSFYRKSEFWFNAIVVRGHQINRHPSKAKKGAESWQYMKTSEKQNWLDNLENAAREVCQQRGTDTVTSYLKQHYGVTSLEELSPADYDRVFDDLDLMASD